MSQIDTTLRHLIAKEASKPDTKAVLLGVQSGDGRVEFLGAAGDATPDQPYFIASISKMFTATVIMQLVDEGLIDLDGPLAAYLPQVNLDGIHVCDGVDFSQQLKVQHLLHQTSGLADYYEGQLIADLKRNKDRAFALDDVLSMVRGMEAAAKPDSGKSHYSDTNYQLLGAIIEAVSEQSLECTFEKRIFEPLELTETALFDGSSWRDRHHQPLPIFHKAQRLDIPMALSSMGPDGGIVSTLADNLRFLRAYFGGELFEAEHVSRMRNWNNLFFPIQYGYGLMRFKLPRWMNLFRDTPELVGHSGSSGSFAFFAPKHDLYLAGTFNQVDKPQRPFGFMLKAVKAIDDFQK